MSSSSTESDEVTRSLCYQLSLLRSPRSLQNPQEMTTTPIFTAPVLEHSRSLQQPGAEAPFPQYGLLAGLVDAMSDSTDEENVRPASKDKDPRVFFNVAAPSSVFICGSQGSGKSHSLACLLENCLIPSKANTLPRPLTGLVFHYDAFISDDGGSPCEAAYLSSHAQIKVRVLCSPTNYRTIQRTYDALNVDVQCLRISPGDLNTKRMIDLMAVDHEDGPVPLYLHTAYRILREMRIEQQEIGGSFNYEEFKLRITSAGLLPSQLGPLQQRLDTLESFLSQMKVEKGWKKPKNSVARGTDWSCKPGHLTIVDLSCPCVTPEGACSLFNICLSIFLQQDMTAGRVIALDEAHKFMNQSAEALTFTNTLLSTIRLQRHLGARIVISTQEPTISSDLLDLCSTTIVHRFTSPAWLRSLKQHLAAKSSSRLNDRPSLSDGGSSSGNEDGPDNDDSVRGILGDVVQLGVGEALLFAPSAMLSLKKGEQGTLNPEMLGTRYVKIRVRARVTTDGGKSVMAS